MVQFGRGTAPRTKPRGLSFCGPEERRREFGKPEPGRRLPAGRGPPERRHRRADAQAGAAGDRPRRSSTRSTISWTASSSATFRGAEGTNSIAALGVCFPLVIVTSAFGHAGRRGRFLPRGNPDGGRQTGNGGTHPLQLSAPAGGVHGGNRAGLSAVWTGSSAAGGRHRKHGGLRRPLFPYLCAGDAAGADCSRSELLYQHAGLRRHQYADRADRARPATLCWTLS